MAEVDRGRGLADPALDVVGGDDLHECTPAVSISNRACAWRTGERGEPAGELAAGPPFPLADVGREVPHGQQCGGRHAAGGEQVAGDGPDLLLLHLAVLVGAQAVLQALQVAYRPPVRGQVVQCGEEFQGVPQLLAPFAQVVKLLRRGVVVDGGAAGQDPPVRPAGYPGGGVCRVRAPARRGHAGQHAAPRGGERREARGAQGAGQPPLLDGAPLRPGSRGTAPGRPGWPRSARPPRRRTSAGARRGRGWAW